MDATLQFDALNVQADDGSRLFSFVDGLDEQRTLGCYSASQLKTIASYVTATLDASGDDDESAVQLRGLSLLGVLVEQSSSAAFTELHAGWVQSLLRVLGRPAVDSGIRLLAAETLALVLEYAAGFPEHARQLSVSAVPQLVQQQLIVDCASGERDVSDVVLMLAVLRHYPGACRAHAFALRRRIINLLMVASLVRPNLESTAAECLALLPHVGGVSHEGSTKSDAADVNWTKLYAQLCGSINIVLDDLYDGHEGERTASNPTDRLPPNWLPEYGSSDDADLSPCRSLRLLLLCVGKLLIVDSDASVRSARAVPVEDTMALLCRILNVNLKTLTACRLSRRTLLASISLPEIHRTALRVLEHLLVVCGRHMSLHGTSVLGIVTKTLQWTTGGEVDACHPSSRLRIAAYEVLVTWLEVVQSPSSLTAIQEPLIANILSDVAPRRAQASVVLGTANGGRHRSKKRAKRDFESVVDVVHRKVSPWADSELCSAALDALGAVLCYGADSLKTRTLKEIQETVLKVCRNVQSIDVSFPYGNHECRLALYELLAATLVHRTPDFVPDLGTCIGVFSRGAALDVHREVGRCCTRALATCHLLTNPYRRSMFASAAVTAVEVTTTASVVSPNRKEEPGMSFAADVVRAATKEKSSAELEDDAEVHMEITVNGGDEVSTKEVVSAKEVVSDKAEERRVLEIVLTSSPEVTSRLHVEADETEEEEGDEEVEEEESGVVINVGDVREVVVDETEITENKPETANAITSSTADDACGTRMQCEAEDAMQMISSFVDSRPDDA